MKLDESIVALIAASSAGMPDSEDRGQHVYVSSQVVARKFPSVSPRELRKGKKTLCVPGWLISYVADNDALIVSGK
jgi:hypothetical protein